MEVVIKGENKKIVKASEMKIGEIGRIVSWPAPIIYLHQVVIKAFDVLISLDNPANTWSDRHLDCDSCKVELIQVKRMVLET